MGGGHSAPEQAGKDAGPAADSAMNIVETVEKGFARTTKQHARRMEHVQLLATVWAEVRFPGTAPHGLFLPPVAAQPCCRDLCPLGASKYSSVPAS